MKFFKKKYEMDGLWPPPGGKWVADDVDGIEALANPADPNYYVTKLFSAWLPRV